MGSAGGALHCEIWFGCPAADDDKSTIDIPTAETTAPERMLLPKRFIVFRLLPEFLIITKTFHSLKFSIYSVDRVLGRDKVLMI